jgi:hypothetical protein
LRPQLFVENRRGQRSFGSRKPKDEMFGAMRGFIIVRVVFQDIIRPDTQKGNSTAEEE